MILNLRKKTSKNRDHSLTQSLRKDTSDRHYVIILKQEKKKKKCRLTQDRRVSARFKTSKVAGEEHKASTRYHINERASSHRAISISNHNLRNRKPLKTV